MTVAELVEELKNCNPELKVYVNSADADSELVPPKVQVYDPGGAPFIVIGEE